MSNAPKKSADRAEVERAIRTLFPDGAVTEVRLPKTGRYGTVSGYFDDPGKLRDAICVAADHYPEAPGLYWTINPCEPALLARAANRLKERAEYTTADGGILRRRWLPVDIDPVRPSGIASSDEEHELALAKAREIRAALAPTWGQPVLADSGNGGHLLYRIDLPNDEDSLALIKAVLAGLDRQFSDERVRVDTALLNASRILKIYGTTARKGDNTAERPWRGSRAYEGVIQ